MKSEKWLFSLFLTFPVKKLPLDSALLTVVNKVRK